MSKEVRVKLESIVINYFKKSTYLFKAITFHNKAIIYANQNPDSELKNSLDDLRTLLLENYNNDFIDRHMPALCFSALVSAYEEFIIELLALTLKTYPQKISTEQIDFKKVLELSKDELIEFKAKEFINQIMYKSPKDYLKSLSNLLSIDSNLLKNDFNKYIEIKARRDLGVHNNWVKNEIYIRKVKDANLEVENEDILLPTFNYYRSAYETCTSLVTKITNSSCNSLFKVDKIFSS